jgi:hypothetical protein
MAIITSKGWIGVDLDGTLAKYEGWRGPTHIGEPIPAMVARIQALLAAGYEVRVFTARMSHEGEARDVNLAVMEWTSRHIGQALRATCIKDFAMVHLFDDRATGVEPNTGRLLSEVAL